MVAIDARFRRLGTRGEGAPERERLHNLHGAVIEQYRRGPLVSYSLVLGTNPQTFRASQHESYTRAIFQFRIGSSHRNGGMERVETSIPEGEKYAGAISIIPLPQHLNTRVVIRVNAEDDNEPVLITTRKGRRRSIRDTVMLSREQLRELGWDVDPSARSEQGKILDMNDYGPLLRFLYDVQHKKGELFPEKR